MVDRGTGVVTGVAVGALLGVATGLLGAATYHDSCAGSNSWGCVSRPRTPVAVLSGVAVALPSMALGAALGAIVGVRTRYAFGPSD